MYIYLIFKDISIYFFQVCADVNWSGLNLNVQKKNSASVV